MKKLSTFRSFTYIKIKFRDMLFALEHGSSAEQEGITQYIAGILKLEHFID